MLFFVSKCMYHEKITATQKTRVQTTNTAILIVAHLHKRKMNGQDGYDYRMKLN